MKMTEARYTPRYGIMSLDDALTCASCSEDVTDPLTLEKCSHSLCMSCADSLLQQAENNLDEHQRLVICPICEEDSQEIRLNFFVRHLIKIKRKGFKSRGDFCDQCFTEEDLVMARNICLDCKTKICEICCRHHRKIEVLKGHEIVDISESDRLKTQNYGFCVLHKGKPQEFYCEDCEITICVECKTSQHSAHTTDPVDSALARLLPGTVQAASTLERRLNDLQKTIDVLVQYTEANQASYERCLREVDENAENMIEKIRAQQKKLKASLRYNQEKDSRKLHEVSMEVNYEKDKIDNLKDVIRVQLEKACDFNYFTLLDTLLKEKIYSSITDKTEWLENRRIAILPVVMHTPEVLIAQDHCSIKELMPTVVYNIQNFQVSLHGLLEMPEDELVQGRHWPVNFEKVFDDPLLIYQSFAFTEAFRFSVISDEIWVPQRQRDVIVYSKCGEILDEIEIKHPRSVCEASNGDVFIACDSGVGLHVTTSRRVPKKICAGSFSDVYAFNDNIYALDYCSATIYAFSRKNTRTNSWKGQFSVKLQGGLTKRSSSDSLIVYDGSKDMMFLVSWYEEGVVMDFNSIGELLREFGRESIKESILCAIDYQTCVLLADIGHQQLKLLKLDTGDVIPLEQLSNFGMIYNDVGVHPDGSILALCTDSNSDDNQPVINKFANKVNLRRAVDDEDRLSPTY